jgi:alpha/beta superfamily hydrolase
MQLLMRRPEIDGFIAVAPPANLYDFSFLAPCPSSGLMINGADDRVVPPDSVKGLVDKLKTQKGIIISHETIPGANHFFENRLEDMIGTVHSYLDQRLDPSYRLPAPGKKKKIEE